MRTATRLPAFTRRLLATTTIALSLSLLAGGTAQAAPDTTAIKPPSSNTEFFRVYAIGTQVYQCRINDQGSWAWLFIEPRASLWDAIWPMGTHYAGPTWKANDGSTVVGEKIASMPSPDGSIPWLLLRAKSATYGPGGGNWLTKSTYIQRINTTGGQTPTDWCDEITGGSFKAVPYTATYVFYLYPWL